MLESAKAQTRDGRLCTPQPHSPRRDHVRSLVFDIRAEAKDQRDDAEALDRWADRTTEPGQRWIARAKAFKRRATARDLFLIGDNLEAWCAGRESLDTLAINGKSFRDMAGVSS